MIVSSHISPITHCPGHVDHRRHGTECPTLHTTQTLHIAGGNFGFMIIRSARTSSDGLREEHRSIVGATEPAQTGSGLGTGTVAVHQLLQSFINTVSSNRICKPFEVAAEAGVESEQTERFVVSGVQCLPLMAASWACQPVQIVSGSFVCTRLEGFAYSATTAARELAILEEGEHLLCCVALSVELGQRLRSVKNDRFVTHITQSHIVLDMSTTDGMAQKHQLYTAPQDLAPWSSRPPPGCIGLHGSCAPGGATWHAPPPSRLAARVRNSSPNSWLRGAKCCRQARSRTRSPR